MTSYATAFLLDADAVPLFSRVAWDRFPVPSVRMTRARKIRIATIPNSLEGEGLCMIAVYPKESFYPK
jgi:hypothetical protein